MVRPIASSKFSDKLAILMSAMMRMNEAPIWTSFSTKLYHLPLRTGCIPDFILDLTHGYTFRHTALPL